MLYKYHIMYGKEVPLENEECLEPSVGCKKLEIRFLLIALGFTCILVLI